MSGRIDGIAAAAGERSSLGDGQDGGHRAEIVDVSARCGGEHAVRECNIHSIDRIVAWCAAERQPAVVEGDRFRGVRAELEFRGVQRRVVHHLERALRHGRLDRARRAERKGARASLRELSGRGCVDCRRNVLVHVDHRRGERGGTADRRVGAKIDKGRGHVAVDRRGIVRCPKHGGFAVLPFRCRISEQPRRAARPSGASVAAVPHVEGIRVRGGNGEDEPIALHAPRVFKSRLGVEPVLNVRDRNARHFEDRVRAGTETAVSVPRELGGSARGECQRRQRNRLGADNVQRRARFKHQPSRERHLARTVHAERRAALYRHGTGNRKPGVDDRRSRLAHERRGGRLASRDRQRAVACGRHRANAAEVSVQRDVLAVLVDDEPALADGEPLRVVRRRDDAAGVAEHVPRAATELHGVERTVLLIDRDRLRGDRAVLEVRRVGSFRVAASGSGVADVDRVQDVDDRVRRGKHAGRLDWVEVIVVGVLTEVQVPAAVHAERGIDNLHIERRRLIVRRTVNRVAAGKHVRAVGELEEPAVRHVDVKPSVERCLHDPVGHTPTAYHSAAHDVDRAFRGGIQIEARGCR